MENKRKSRVKNRIRAYKPKVLTGCITCKARHVKCDEGKPSCHECTKTGRTCDGYGPVVKRNKQIVFITNASPCLPYLDPALVTGISGNRRELRSLDFFRSETIPQLRGIFGSDFWEGSILRTSFHEPAVKHAVIALGSLHENLYLNDDEFRDDWNRDSRVFAMEQYLKSISCLTQAGKPQTIDVTLMTCALFICFEALRGQLGSAIRHVDGGVKIITDFLSASASKSASAISSVSPYVSLNTLNLIFVRLDTQAAQISHGHHQRLAGQIMFHEHQGIKENVPTRFESLEQARDSLDHIWAATCRAYDTLPKIENVIIHGPTPSLRMALDLIDNAANIRLKQWVNIFDAFLESRSAYTNAIDDQAIHTLRVHYIMTRLLVNVDHLKLAVDETVWDQYIPEFEEIISSSAIVVAAGAKTLKPTFCLEQGVNLALYFVASKCRQSSIRKKAISILNATSKHEGLINSKLAARAAMRVVEIEEQACEGDVRCESIPNSARLRGVAVRFDPDEKKAYLGYVKWSSDGKFTNETFQEYVGW